MGKWYLVFIPKGVGFGDSLATMGCSVMICLMIIGGIAQGAYNVWHKVTGQDIREAHAKFAAHVAAQNAPFWGFNISNNNAYWKWRFTDPKHRPKGAFIDGCVQDSPAEVIRALGPNAKVITAVGGKRVNSASQCQHLLSQATGPDLKVSIVVATENGPSKPQIIRLHRMQ